MQARGAHQVGFELGQTAFGEGGVAAHQAFADHKTEDRVSQEFQLFVIDQLLAVHVLFVDPRSMGESPFQQLALLEHMSQDLFQALQAGAHQFTSSL